MIPKYPDVFVQLTGGDGNAFAIIGAVSKAIGKKHGRDAQHAASREMMASQSYDALLGCAMSLVDCG